MENETLLWISLIALLLGIAIMYFLFRWIFEIQRQLWNQKTVIDLLIKIAEKHGVDSDFLSNVQEKNNKVSS
jgi:uncharacterized membrane protein YdjX (TVP38/TMEM64 family)